MEYVQSGKLARVQRVIGSPGVPSKSSEVVRFLEKVKIAPGAHSCWEWQAASSQGYGRFGGKAAHRYSYELFVGPIPEGLQIDHLCRNPPCVKPDHLEPVTPEMNVHRGLQEVTCDRWHPNTRTRLRFMPSLGLPVCVECARWRERERQGLRGNPGETRQAKYDAARAKAPKDSDVEEQEA